jgi:hypothetical protein
MEASVRHRRAAPYEAPRGVAQGTPTAVIEGGADFDADDEPNFNRVDGVVASVEAGAARPEGGREGRPSGGGGDRDRNRRRRGRGRSGSWTGRWFGRSRRRTLRRWRRTRQKVVHKIRALKGYGFSRAAQSW